MSVAIITGSAGLVGSEAARYFASLGMQVAGIDNGMRADFFGPEASTDWVRDRLQKDVQNYRHYDTDIRDADAISSIFREYSKDISLIIHAAAQPSHDWAASQPMPCSFICLRTRCTEIGPIRCLWLNLRRGGRLIRTTHTQRLEFQRRCRSTTRFTAFSVFLNWQPMFWFRNMGATLACRPAVFAADA